MNLLGQGERPTKDRVRALCLGSANEQEGQNQGCREQFCYCDCLKISHCFSPFSGRLLRFARLMVENPKPWEIPQ
jgi:hypothetical protein